MLKHPLLAFTAALALAPGLARAAEPPCLTAPEFTALASFALPGLITGTAKRCATTLPATAFLHTDAESMAARYAPSRAAAWPAAKLAFFKLAGGDPAIADTLKGMDDATLQQLASAMIVVRTTQNLPLARCAVIDRMVQLLAPLPPENTAELIAVALGLGAAGHARFGKLAVCPA